MAWEMSVYVGKDDLGENVMMNGRYDMVIVKASRPW